MSRQQRRATYGVNATARVKAVTIRIGEIRRLRDDKNAHAGSLGTEVASFAWTSDGDIWLPLGGAETEGNVGSVLVAPQRVGFYRINSLATFDNGAKALTSWVVEVPAYPDGEDADGADFGFLQLMEGDEFDDYLLLTDGEEMELA
jgi:hypothetical protein